MEKNKRSMPFKKLKKGSRVLFESSPLEKKVCGTPLEKKVCGTPLEKKDLDPLI